MELHVVNWTEIDLILLDLSISRVKRCRRHFFRLSIHWAWIKYNYSKDLDYYSKKWIKRVLWCTKERFSNKQEFLELNLNNFYNERKREFLKRTMKRTLRKYLGRMSFPLVIIITMMILKERSVEWNATPLMFSHYLRSAFCQ